MCPSMMGGICLTRGPQISRAALSIMMAAPTVAIMAALKKDDLPSSRLISKTWINNPINAAASTPRTMARSGGTPHSLNAVQVR